MASASSRRLLEDAAGDVPAAELVVVAGPNAGTAFPLNSQNIVGRTTSADIHLPDPGVSRRHACVTAARGAFWLLDLGSTNTTHVNGHPIDKHELHDGDDIELGPWRLRYRLHR
jgi:pSer/pThr/pTyr-binding forkhead associated (FHA) protein